MEEKRGRWFEICLVVLVGCGGPFLNSLYLLKYGPSAMPRVTNVRWLVGLVQEISGLLLLGYVLSRRGRRLRDLGRRWTLKDVGTGLLMAGFSFAIYLLGSTLIHLLHFAIYGALATGPSSGDFFAHPSVLAIPFTLVNPFFEELLVRAYLMTEIVELTGSSALAIVVSVAVQTSYHLYYGWSGALSLAFLFLAFALYFARTRRALPIIVAHGVFDIYGLVRLW